MRSIITLLAVGFGVLLQPDLALAQCTTAANTYTDLNGAGGAPCFDGTTCAITDPDFTTAGFGVYGSEAYLLDNVQAGADYVYSQCTGIGAGNWIPSITIVAPSGAVDAFNPGTTGDFAANCSISWTATESGTYSIIIHEAGAVCGTALAVDNGNPTVTCGATPAPCNIVPCEAGVLDISSSPLSLCPGEAYDLTTDGSESTNGAFAVLLSPQAGASGGLNDALFLSPIQTFPLTGIDNDLGGLLSANSLPPLLGTWAFYTLAYNDLNDAQGSVCSISADSVMVTFLASTAPQCIPCTADAGTLTAVETPVCLVGGSATIAATPNGNSVVPAGYSTGYAVTDANGVVQQIGLTPSFTVSATGDYTIHTIVYDPTTLNPLLFTPGVTTAADVNALLIQGGGTICGSLDLTGAPIEVITCVTCTADAGTLTAVSTSVCLLNGTATIAATPNGNSVVPSGFSTGYAVTDANGVVQQIGLTPSFTVSSTGDYTIHTIVYDPTTLNPLLFTPGVTTAADVNALLIQGGGTICGSLDLVGAPVEVVACIPCDANAGTITADVSPVCLSNGSASISATSDGNSVVPSGYQTLYVLTQGTGLVIIDAAATPNFTVTASGEYTIHTLIFDPLTLDITTVQFGVTTGFDVNGLLQQGGGSICGSLDVAGAPIVVEAPVAGTLSANAQTCLINGSGTITATSNGDAVVPSGYSVLYGLADANGTIQQIGTSLSFPVTATGTYTVHTLVYDPTTLDISMFLPGLVTISMVNGAIASTCAAFDATGVSVDVVACVQCNTNAGTLAATASPVCLDDLGAAVISASANGNAVVPSGYQTLYVLTQGSGLVIIDAAASPSFTVNAAGNYTIHTLVFDPLTLDISSVQFGVTTGFDVNGLLQQGGGVICGSLDVTGAPIVVEDCSVPCVGLSTGALVTSSNLICLFEGSAVLAATHTQLPSFPIGYEVLYVLTEGSGLTIVDANTFPIFTVSAGGNYTIHTLVYDPLTLDPSTATTGVQVNALLQQGGGNICGALDVAGVAIAVPALESTIGIIANDGDSLYLSNATGTSDYQWFFNGNPIPGATTSSYVIEESGNYAVQYTGENGCIQSSSTLPFSYSGGNIGIDEQSVFRSVALFPNPNNGVFSIRAELKERADLTITLIDVAGRIIAPVIMIQDTDVFTQPIDVSNTASGFYFVRIQSLQGDMTIRFAKH